MNEIINILNQNKNILCRAVDTLGYKTSIIAMEELSELQQAISKTERDKTDINNLSEEIVDVLICIEWLIYKNKIDKEQLKNWTNKKVQRIKERIDTNTLI